MDISSWQEWATLALQPTPLTVGVTFLIAMLLPILLHTYLYRKQASTQLPSFLLVGPCESGKTSLLTMFERGHAAETRTSLTPLTVQCSLPVGTVVGSNQYRSVNDPTNKQHKNFLLVDTPGHGKLRHFALDHVTKPQNVKGILFVIDAAALAEDGSTGSETAALTEAAQYLHDVLLTLQIRQTRTKTSKGASQMPVMVVANKLDLFTAYPAQLVKYALEREITKLRTTRSKGLVDSGVGMDDDQMDDPEMLGGGGEEDFEFKLLEEYNVLVEVVGGNVIGGKGADAKDWWDWIGRHL